MPNYQFYKGAEYLGSYRLFNSAAANRYAREMQTKEGGQVTWIIHGRK